VSWGKFRFQSIFVRDRGSLEARLMRARARPESQHAPLKKFSLGTHLIATLAKKRAELTGLEPATSAVTGQRSNQLSYNSRAGEREAKTECRSLQPKSDVVSTCDLGITDARCVARRQWKGRSKPGVSMQSVYSEVSPYSGYAGPFRCSLALTNALGFVTCARNWRLVSMRDNVNLPLYATRLRSACCAASSWRATHSAKAPSVRRLEHSSS
jgi:hypothetical protein